MARTHTRAVAVLVAAALASMLSFVAPAGAARVEQSGWAQSADKVCRRADERMFDQLDRHDDLDVTVPLSALTRRERRALLAILGIAGDTASRAVSDLGAIRVARSDRARVDAVIKALLHSAKTQRVAAAATRRARADSSLLVADTASPDEIAAVGIDRAGELGAHECGLLLADLLWYRETSLLLGSTPEEIAALIVPQGPSGFTAVGSDTAGPIDITLLAEGYAGTGETTDDAVIELQYLGFNAGHVVEFEVPGTFEWASVEVLEFADPAGAAAYLDDVRWATEDEIDDVHTVADIDSAWGYSETFPSGETSTYVAFRSGPLVFYVSMTGVPGYSEDEVLAFAQSQVAYVESGPGSATNTPEDAIGAELEARGERFVGDCAGADPSTDVGSYCSLLLEDHGNSRLYGIGPVASEITDRVTVTLDGASWVVPV